MRLAFRVGIFILSTAILLASLGTPGAVNRLQAKTGVDQPASAALRAGQPRQASFDIVLNEVASGFSRPVQVTHAGDGSGRLFVVEQDGRIKIIDNDSVLLTPFLSIPNLVLSPADGTGNNERGLLGLAFHPNYGTNGYFYVNYTNNNGDTVIARYAVSANPNAAEPASAFIILTIAQPYSNHNGGQLLFGPDGYLYIGMGDGGSGDDPENRAQNIDSPLGKLLRIDVDNPQAGKNYGIPADNPFVGQAGLDEIWALGLRNPWRFSFDRATGDIYLGDVGQGAWEEIDYQPAGQAGLNYGWKVREGPCQRGETVLANCTPNPAQYQAPIAFYDRSLGRSVTGGFVYRGSKYPALAGYYFYADFVTGRIWTLTKSGAGWTTPAQKLDTSYNISAFGEDEAGELYVANHGGTIYELADVNGAVPQTTLSKRVVPLSADPGEVFAYTISLAYSGLEVDSTFVLTDVIQPGLTYVPGSLAATQGGVDPSGAPTLTWSGSFSPSRIITVTYAVTATGAVTGSIPNTVTLAGAGIAPQTASAFVHVPKFTNIYYFPVIMKASP